MSSNKTEQATPHKLNKAKKDGDVARSKELATAVVMASLIVGLAVLMDPIGESFTNIFHMAFSSTDFIDGGSRLILPEINRFFAWSFAFGIWICIHTVIGTVILGGFIIAPKKMVPKLSNISLKKGVKKVISTQNLFETIKAIFKLSIIGCISYIFIVQKIPDFIAIRWVGRNDLYSIVGSTIINYLAIMVAVLIVFSLIDIPFQIKSFKKKMMMTLKEVRDEYKQTDGNPEIKGKIKQKQREASERKHISETKSATLVLTNPTHYSVALYFDYDNWDPPRIISMGSDNNAFRIREIATQNEIPVLSIPPLARALYFEGEIGHQIPRSLYEPVSMILTYLVRLDDKMSFDVAEISQQITMPEGYLDIEA